jgi:hypothetical protein
VEFINSTTPDWPRAALLLLRVPHTGKAIFRLHDWVIDEYYEELLNFLSYYDIIEKGYINPYTNTREFYVLSQRGYNLFLGKNPLESYARLREKVRFYFRNLFTDFCFLPLSEDDPVSITLSPRHFTYPNPSRSGNIRFSLISENRTSTTTTEINIFNIRGQLINSSSDFTTVGTNRSFTWDRRDRLGRDVPSGVYFYQIRDRDNVHTGRFLILRD